MKYGNAASRIMFLVRDGMNDFASLARLPTDAITNVIVRKKYRQRKLCSISSTMLITFLYKHNYATSDRSIVTCLYCLYGQSMCMYLNPSAAQLR